MARKIAKKIITEIVYTRDVVQKAIYNKWGTNLEFVDFDYIKILNNRKAVVHIGNRELTLPLAHVELNFL